MKTRASVVRVLTVLIWLCCSSVVLVSHVHALAASAAIGDAIYADRNCLVEREQQSGDGYSAFIPELSIVGTLPPGTLGLPGEQIDWLITLINDGTAAGTNIVVTDVLRDELRVDHVVADNGIPTVDGQRIDLVIPVLSPGEMVAMQITTTVLRGSATGSLINRVTMTAQGPDGEVVESAVAEVFVPTRLPATGYPPQQDLPGEGEPSAFVVALFAFSIVAISAWIIWRRGQWSYE